MANRKRRGRGEGSIYQEPSGRWVCCVSLGFKANGKRRRVKVRGKTKEEVQAKLRELQAAGPQLADVGGLKVGEYMQRWLDNTASESVQATTWQRYEQLVRLHIIPRLGNVKLADLSAVHIEHYYGGMKRDGLSAWTRRMSGIILTIALNHAVRKLGLIPSNPAAAVAKPRAEHKEMLFLSEEQVKLLLAAARSARLYALISLAAGSGMRQGELLGLQWSDIDFDNSTVTVRRSLALVRQEFVVKEPKSKRSCRTIALPPFVMVALQAHRAAMLAEGNIAAPVFCTKAGGYIRKYNLTRRVFKPALKVAGLPNIRFHDLRHTHATLLLARGYSLKAVSQRLGHATVELTLRVYAHVLPSDDAKLAAGLQAMYG